MPKTRRDILQAIAEKCGGRIAVQITRLTKRSPAPDKFLDRSVSDEEYASEMKKLAGDITRLSLPTIRWSLLDHLDDLDGKKNA